MKKYFQNILLAILITVSQTFSYAQASDVAWFNQSYSDWVYPMDLAVDVYQNQYYTGYFSDTLLLANDTLISKGGKDIFILKYNAAGNYVWGISIGSSLDDQGQTICIDQGNDIIIAGSYMDTVDFDPSNAVYEMSTFYPLVPYEPNHGFVLKLNAGGGFEWAKKFAYTPGMTFVRSITALNGSIYLGGYFGSMVDVNTNDTIANIIPAHGYTDGFVFKLNNHGVLLWYKTFGGFDNAGLTDFTLDNYENIFFSGFYNGHVNFYPDSMPSALNGMAYRDMIFGKYDSSGQLQFVKQINGSGFYDQASSIKLDSNKRIVLAGSFGYTVDFNPNAGINNLTAHTSGLDSYFMAQYDSVGNFNWAKMFHPGDVAYVNSFPITLNIVNNNNIIWTAWYVNSPNFTTLVDGTIALTNVIRGSFISKVDNMGNPIWVRDYSGRAHVSQLKIRNNYSVYTTGWFSDQCDFDIESGTYYENNTQPSPEFFNMRTSYPTLNISEESSIHFNLYPNPTTEIISIHTEAPIDNITYTITNMQGEALLSGMYVGPIIVDGLANGIYFLSMQLMNGNHSTHKFIKQ